MSRAEKEPRKHTIAVLVENRDDVLTRVSGLLSARGYDILSIAIGGTLDAATARITVVVRGDDLAVEQVVKRLRTVIEVIRVSDITDVEHLEREMVLVRVAPHGDERAEVLRIAEVFRAKIVDMTPRSFVLEATGDESKISALLDLLRPFGIVELVRTGKIAIVRDAKTFGRKRRPADAPVDARVVDGRDQPDAVEVLQLGPADELAELRVTAEEEVDLGK